MMKTSWWTRWGALCLVAVAAAICAGVPSFLVGFARGYLRNDRERGNRDVDQVKAILAANPKKFGSLTISRGPGDKFTVEGFVEAPEDLQDLRDKLARTFGEERARDVEAVTVCKGRVR